ncbi:MAG TPA: DUF2268 domain-containing putative Zn-dependent protease [Luteibacter sp.]|jgi:hypothetical protein|nr:DUF2268 domain-containing putative Zn-dependent protease [Luteibacter sp.]
MRRSAKKIAVSLLMIASCTAVNAAAPAGPAIRTEDVTRFYQVYDGANGHPTVAQIDQDYLAPGSAGLHEFARLRNVSGTTIAAAIDKKPEIYTDARRCLAVLPTVKKRLVTSFATLVHLYPEAKLPPVTLLVGRGRPVGITNPSGVSIGLEAICAADFMDPDLVNRFVHSIAHEYGHIQQPADLQALDPGQPGATVLRMSLMEGVGEFTAELISGDIANYRHKAWTKGREMEIESAFVKDEDKMDLSSWLYNGPGDANRPGDLGYWVGYRIVKSYYQHATDKRQALRDIYAMTDPKAFVAKSDWHPGD